ncbi:MAG TPA: hypothetical protein VEC99_00640, partial [Clostridia bacterium]|nr:hypothetical protein [Clostridia bacterium]
MKNIKHTLVSLSACLIVAAAMAGPAKDSPVFQMRLVAFEKTMRDGIAKNNSMAGTTYDIPAQQGGTV